MWNVIQIQIIWLMIDTASHCGSTLWTKNEEKFQHHIEARKSNIGYSVKFISHLTENLGFWVCFTKTVLLMTFSEIIVSYYQNMRKVPTRCEGNIQSFFSLKSD